MCLFYQAGQDMEPFTVPSHVVYRQKREERIAIESLDQNYLGCARVRDELVVLRLINFSSIHYFSSGVQVGISLTLPSPPDPPPPPPLYYQQWCDVT